ncbi:hypothetical protein GZH47_30670 [Paenibacillus rhizovicinus]|uniref:Uncharacterized protein n=1 Tax=Paenibacillus rhizovicinus TaxID=2704463 RepID=A0A6C0PCK0_9BACL|nr:hypothetical protein [Paenibacillus rhizovicinus]QHW34732.1 hypothetical protein GZH47_30670 [Paenibacillus rhizovicinus]
MRDLKTEQYEYESIQHVQQNGPRIIGYDVQPQHGGLDPVALYGMDESAGDRGQDARGQSGL